MKVYCRYLTDNFLVKWAILFSVFAGSILSLFFCLNIFFPFYFIFILIYLFLLIKYPEISLLIAILVIFNLFSMINEDIFSVPNLYKIRDIFFISSFFHLVKGILKKDRRIRYVLFNPIGKLIYLILFLSFLQIFITKLKFPEESLNSIIKIARIYLYYLFFFPALYVLLEKNRLKRFLISFVFIIIIFCSVFIIQFFLGPFNKIFLWGRVETQLLQGFYITRIYVTGERVPAFVFLICFMIFIFYKKYKYKIENVFLMILCAMQTLLTSGRAHIFGVITGALFSISMIKGQKKLKSISKIIIFTLSLFVILETASKILMPGKDDFLKYISSRIVSTYNAVIHKDDTFFVRMRDSAGRIELIKRYPLFGIGFVHDESNLFARERGEIGNAIRTSDSGIIVLLLDFGIIGVIWLFMISILFLIRGINILKKTDNLFIKSLILGTIAYYFGRLFSFITLADFVLYEGIVVISLSYVIIEIFNYFLDNNEQNKIIYHHS